MAKAKNSITNLGTVLGSMLLPKVGEVAEKVSNLATKFSEFAQENPQVIATVAKVAKRLSRVESGRIDSQTWIFTGKRRYFVRSKGFYND